MLMCGTGTRASLLSVGGGELQKVGWVDFTWVQICRGEWQPDFVLKHPSCNLNAIMHSPHPVPPWLTVLGWTTWAYLHLVLLRELVFLFWPATAPVTCSSYYWTLFRRQSRKEERRGTLIAHLNGGCHIINAYRPALQAVTETPSHTSREEEGEWDINSCERRDGYQQPEIKWLACSEGDEARNEAPVWVGLRRTCFAQYLPLCSRSAPSDPLCLVSSLLPIACFACDRSDALIWSE